MNLKFTLGQIHRLYANLHLGLLSFWLTGDFITSLALYDADIEREESIPSSYVLPLRQIHGKEVRSTRRIGPSVAHWFILPP